MENRTQLQDLNDDCLLTILHQLPQFDYWRMRKVCTRFYELITNDHCSSHYKHWYDAASADEAEETKDFEIISLEKFKFLLEYMDDVAEHVDVHRLSEKHFELLDSKKTVFLKVHTLKVRVPHNTIGYKNGKGADIIAEAFPKVNRLTYEGLLLDGSGFGKMSELKQLELYCDDALDTSTDFISSICQQCQLTSITYQASGANQRIINDFCCGIKICANTLEEITVSSEFLVACMREISKTQMPQLQRLSYVDIELFEGEEGCFDNNLFGSLAERIYRFGSNFDYIPLPFDALSDLRNLEQLIISDAGVTCESIQRLSEYFPYLTEVQFWNKDTYFQKYSEEEDEDGNGDPTLVSALTFLTSLILNQNLNIVYIPIEWIGDQFELSELLIVLRKQHNRNIPLQLRIFVPKEIGKKQRVEMLQTFNARGNEELLQISLHDSPIGWNHWDSITRHYFEIRMKYLNSN